MQKRAWVKCYIIISHITKWQICAWILESLIGLMTFDIINTKDKPVCSFCHPNYTWLVSFIICLYHHFPEQTSNPAAENHWNSDNFSQSNHFQMNKIRSWVLSNILVLFTLKHHIKEPNKSVPVPWDSIRRQYSDTEYDHFHAQWFLHST